jgi:hypothetical protein
MDVRTHFLKQIFNMLIQNVTQKRNIKSFNVGEEKFEQFLPLKKNFFDDGG